jgi:hypothetical protein
MQLSQGLANEEEVMGTNYAFETILLGPLTFLTERSRWHVIGELKWDQWGIIVGLAAGVVVGANVLQQLAIYKLGGCRGEGGCAWLCRCGRGR